MRGACALLLLAGLLFQGCQSPDEEGGQGVATLRIAGRLPHAVDSAVLLSDLKDLDQSNPDRDVLHWFIGVDSLFATDSFDIVLTKNFTCGVSVFDTDCAPADLSDDTLFLRLYEDGEGTWESAFAVQNLQKVAKNHYRIP